MQGYARHTLFAVFFLSGAVGLVYEVTWLRLFRIIMGNTVFTSATVLTSFMGGLALGSLLASRLADRVARPLRAYALLEVVLGVYALALPWLLVPAEPVYGWLYTHFAGDTLPLALGRFAVSAALLTIPTTVMGATLPLLSRHITAGLEWVGRDVGRLYGLNTLGAAAGALLAGFVLIPAYGVSTTLILGAVGNAVVCLAAAGLDRHCPVPAAPTAAASAAGVGRPRLAWAVLVAIAATGFASMVYEVAWTRTLTLLIGSSVYAFTLMLGAFIAGLGAGSWVLAGWIDRRRDLVLLLGGLQFVVATAALAVVPLFSYLPGWIVSLVTRHAGSFRTLHLLEFLAVFTLMLVPTFVMGAVFPTVARIYTRDLSRLGRSVGEAYAANTLGAVLGSFAAGFLLIPLIGARQAILLAVAVNALTGLCCWLASDRLRWRWRLGTAAGTVAVLLAMAWRLPEWDPLLLNSAPYLYAYRYQRNADSESVDLDRVMTRNRRLLYAEQGLTAAVTVVESGGETYLKVNGKTDASSHGDRRSQALLSHLPLLHHPDPRQALLIGLGSGISLGALADHPVDEIECVEISPEVVRASHYFTDVNQDALRDPRVQLLIGDGRNHVAHTRQRYDVIISQPSNLWIAGMADLFTREFFTACRQRLAPGGLMCTWVQAYAMRADDFRSIARTFVEVFPHVSMWESVPGGDYYLVGSEAPPVVTPERWSERVALRGLMPDLAAIGVHSVNDVLVSYVLGGESLAAFVDGAAISTDDNARLEFSSPRGLYQGLLGGAGIFTPATLAPFRARRAPFLDGHDELTPAWQARQAAVAGLTAQQQGRYPEALEHLERAAGFNPDDMEVRRIFPRLALDYGQRLSASGNQPQALALYTRAVEISPADAALHYRIGRVHESAGRRDLAMAAYGRSVDANPRYLAGLLRLAALTDVMDRAAAEALYRRAEGLDPHGAGLYSEWGKARLRSQDWDGAIRRFEQGLAIDPEDAQLHNNLGVAYAMKGEYRSAVAAYREAVRLSPGYARAFGNLGDALRRLGDTDAARKAYESALRLEPDNTSTRQAMEAL